MISKLAEFPDLSFTKQGILTFRSYLSIRLLVVKLTHRLLNPFMKQVQYHRRKAYLMNDEPLYRSILERFQSYDNEIMEEINRVICEHFNIMPDLFFRSMQTLTPEEKQTELVEILTLVNERRKKLYK